jgi:hypothetical protein
LDMAREMIAYCGINCAKCPAYRLPRLGAKLHMKGAFQWMLKRGMERARKRTDQNPETRVQNAESPDEKSDSYVICDGCTMIDARCLKPCLVCAVRCCAMETGVAHCALCDRFPCERLQGIWKITVFKDAQPRLEKLHAGHATRDG